MKIFFGSFAAVLAALVDADLPMDVALYIPVYRPTTPPIPICALVDEADRKLLLNHTLEEIVMSFESDPTPAEAVEATMISMVKRGMAVDALKQLALGVSEEKKEDNAGVRAPPKIPVLREAIVEALDLLHKPGVQHPPAILRNSFGSAAALAANSIGFALGVGEVIPFNLCAAKAALTGQNFAVVACECVDSPMLSMGNFGTCQVIKQFELLVGCSSELPDCENLPIFPRLPVEQNEVLKLHDYILERGATPDVIEKNVSQSEGRTYFLFWRILVVLYEWQMRETCGSLGAPPDTPLPGWEDVYRFYALEEGEHPQRQRTPIAVLLKQENGGKNDYILGIRGTRSAFEWQLDLQVAQNYVKMRDSPGGMHSGIAAVASMMLPLIQTTLLRDERQGILGDVYLTGHSLGAGVSLILAAFLSLQFPPSPATRIHAVTFAPPRVGDDAFYRHINSNVNLRTVIAQLDPIPELPCTHTPRCPAEDNFFLSRGYFWGRPKGVVHIFAEDLTEDFQGDFSNIEMSAWHTCAYWCWLTKHFASEGPAMLCWKPSSGKSRFETCPFFKEAKHSAS